ncbi:MAG: hypothetical protein GY797_38330 [Deltaproteobacteria bacterium]|nr:hypothetical protein [Deltaproteobacteria bacterium]
MNRFKAFTIILIISMFNLFVGCSKNKVEVDVDVQLSNEKQQEICGIYDEIRRIESDLPDERIPDGMLHPLKQRGTLEMVLSIKRESLTGLLREALGEQYSSKTRNAVLRKCR